MKRLFWTLILIVPLVLASGAVSGRAAARETTSAATRAQATVTSTLSAPMIYWTNNSLNRVNRCPVDGSGPIEVLYHTTASSVPSSIDLDEAA